MKFNVGPRLAEFGTFNNRAENHGDAKVKAIDLPVKIAITLKELDMIIPLQDGKFSETIYDKKKNLMTHVISPMYVNRKPENVTIQIWDHETDDKKVLLIEETSIKDPVIHFEEKATMYLTFKVQVSGINMKDLDRVIENVENKTRRFKCVAKLPELPFGENDADDGADEGSESTEGEENSTEH